MNDAGVDAVVVGGGHNGLVAAAYLARAGLSVLVLERRAEVGGAAVSFRAFDSVDVRLSRYSYLVSLLPREIADDLGLRVRLRRRRISSYTPVGSGGILADDPASLGADADAWQRFYAMTGSVAERVFPTLTEPLPTKDQLRERVGDDRAWHALFEEPLSEVIESTFTDDTIRGIVLTDALIGTFAPADDPLLRQNRCFLYHVIGNGTGDWDVPVGGMGAVTAELARAAQEAGARIVTGAEVTAIDPGGEVTYRVGDEERTVAGGHVLANVAPRTLAALLGETPDAQPEGAQLKVNMVLRRLPRLKDSTVDPRDAFSGTFHVNESYRQLATAYREADGGRIPTLPPCEIYCHSLTDPSILGPSAQAADMHTLTLFGLHMPARLFRDDNEKAREEALRATLRSLDSVLGESIEDCVLPGCVEAKTPVDLENELGLPAGHIFHQDLSWPYGEEGTWGVETGHDRVLLCGAGAQRGGGVSGIPGHNAAMAVLRSR
ncbi:phytoene desaturase family protein [Kibdelosporangium phytohabitans]|uniref:FAD-dependent oxidoreductase n=1 Tax=Kibdelosporangium phytohabitans TaxID=860235 RepID=A0A0N9I0P8_9PSEU|nr:NAD(P)/FAD-dependent oxidoreductase [Kibdelosporangium phytohabitans]ALG08054.1 FAD-dependent oxidoreductase [Kibdelosporangium phytohabitans]MBE1470977.1 phytoene dehydrogenase-like protein [Kibdelosporangium phytohabitans]